MIGEHSAGEVVGGGRNLEKYRRSMADSGDIGVE